jgi:hypothetical protein
MLAFTMRTLSLSFALLLTAVTATGSHITVSVAKEAVPAANGPELLYVAFTDEPLIVDVAITVYTLPNPRSSAEQIGAFRKLDPSVWWDGLTFTLKSSDGSSRVVPARTMEVIRATQKAAEVNGTLQHRGSFRVPVAEVGDYEIEVSFAGLVGRDAFALRNGSETAAIRDRYLERRAERTADYATFKRIQLERLDLFPKRADILLALAKRSLEAGTLEETVGYYDRAIAVMEANGAEYAKGAPPAAAAEVQQRLRNAAQNIRALQAELPAYFARRSELSLVEESVAGEMRFVLKERRSGKVVRVIREQ